MTTARAETSPAKPRIGPPLSPKQSTVVLFPQVWYPRKSTDRCDCCRFKQFKSQQVSKHVYFVLLLRKDHAKQKERRLSSPSPPPFPLLLMMGGGGGGGIIDSDKHAFQPSCVQHRHSEGVASSRPFLESYIRALPQPKAYSMLLLHHISFVTFPSLPFPFPAFASHESKPRLQLPLYPICCSHDIGIRAPGALFHSLSRS